jgi:hypothetical protein
MLATAPSVPGRSLAHNKAHKTFKGFHRLSRVCLDGFNAVRVGRGHVRMTKDPDGPRDLDLLGAVAALDSVPAMLDAKVGSTKNRSTGR